MPDGSLFYLLRHEKNKESASDGRFGALSWYIGTDRRLYIA